MVYTIVYGGKGVMTPSSFDDELVAVYGTSSSFGDGLIARRLTMLVVIWWCMVGGAS